VKIANESRGNGSNPILECRLSTIKIRRFGVPISPRIFSVDVVLFTYFIDRTNVSIVDKLELCKRRFLLKSL
jgi:hypothetical protein